MAEDCTDGDYLGAYSRFFAEFVARVNPYDQLPVSVSSYNVTEAEIVGEIINVTLQYLNQTQCPPSLQAHLVHQVIQEIKSMCKKQPEDCGYKSQEKVYTSLKLMQAVTGKVNEICTRYLDNSRLALLPPPPSTPLPLVAAGGCKNCRRRMEDRYIVLHELHSMFGIQEDAVANYYAVFDGHAGQDTAVYCATHLHQYLVESVYYPTDPERALREAFITTDTCLVEKSNTQNVCGGTTAVCTLILNKKLYVAWVGDSTATLIKCDTIDQLVNPHRLHREDEAKRIRKMGGEVMSIMGIMRVNGALSVSRAIGDVKYKPFVTGEPEIRSVLLDGSEDFLVIATDGLTDYLEPVEILSILYHIIQRNPNGYKQVHQVLQECAKQAGSPDNITVIVVFLTSPYEIAARPNYTHPYQQHLQVNVILEKMNTKDKPLFLDMNDTHNAINSNLLKQTMMSQEPREHDNDGLLAPSNGKHENGDADYDYSDLGPETDVDAIDDVPTMPVKNLAYEFYNVDSIHDDDDDEKLDKDSNIIDNINVDGTTNANVVHAPISTDNLRKRERDEDEDDDDEDDDDEEDREDDDVRNEIAETKLIQDDADNHHVREQIFDEMSKKVHEILEEGVDDDVEVRKDGERMDNERDVVDDAGPIDYDDLPASPQANKPLQHALINEADNVADSEDSEDEWNYYRVDPNKEKDTTTPVDEPQEPRNEEETEIPEDPADHAESKILSEDIKEEIECESPNRESPELINTEISAERKAEELKGDVEKSCEEEQEEKAKDMDFQLNPNAAEFIPVSPQFAGTRVSLINDQPISGSPFKQVPQMDDIQVPSQSEFEKEVCQRPREVDTEEKEEYQNGDNNQRPDGYDDFTSDQQKATTAIGANLDDSEISSTKAEFGDESTASFLTASDFHRTGISAIDESFSSSERDYDIAKDPMAMSFTPSDFEAAFDKSVDLNAVHNLNDADLEEKNGNWEKEEEDDRAPRSPNFEFEGKMNDWKEEKFNNEEMNLQEEDNEATFIENVDTSKAIVDDLLNLQSEASNVEQQETAKYDHSPLTENYSTEFESEKEPVSIDNDQLLSPSSADIDETKPIDEASEEADIPEHDFQKETCPPETADTPVSISPTPDAIKNDIVSNDAEKITDVRPTTPTESSLPPSAPEFMPRQYNFQSFGDIEVNEFCQSTPAKAPFKEPVDIFQPFGAETKEEQSDNDKQDLLKEEKLNEKEIEELVCVQQTPVQDNLLDFAGEQELCLKPSLIQSELTPPLSPQEVEEKIPKADHDVCSVPSFGVTEEKSNEVVGSKDVPEVTSIVKNKEEEIMEAMMDTVEPMIPTESVKSPELIEIEKPTEPNETLQSIETESMIKEPTLNLSESIQEFTGLESQLQPKEMEEEEEKEEASQQPITVAEVHKEEEIKETAEPKILLEPVVEQECKIQEKKDDFQEIPAEMKEPVARESEIKESEVKQLEMKEPEVPVSETVPEIMVQQATIPEVTVPEVTESEVKAAEIKESESKVPEPEKPVEASKSKTAVAAAAAVATAAVAAGGIAAQSKTKGKPTAAMKSARTTTASKTALTKSTPTSPSKTTTSSTRTQLTATKKPSTTTTSARSKAAEVSKKTTVSSTTISKQTIPKTTSKATTSTTGTKVTSRVSSGIGAKTKSTTSTTTSSTKPITAVTEKKPTANGDVKPLSKTTTTKPPSKTAPATKSTLVKTSTTRMSMGTTTMSKPRPASATTTTKTTTTAKSNTTTTTSSSTAANARPKTAPMAGNVTKPRTFTTAKSPMIDKQVKETANKQISMSRTTSTTATSKTSRLSSSSSTTSTVRRVSSTTKTSSTAGSPTKKSTAVSKVTGKNSIMGGKTASAEKEKIVQNGVSEKVEINTIIDDIPKKELSPVVPPNDNQLIMSSD